MGLDRQAARQQCAEIVGRIFPDIHGFIRFLVAHGYGDVVEAVPESAAATYRHELIVALDRRGHLNEKLFTALAGAKPDEAVALEHVADALGVRVPSAHVAAAERGSDVAIAGPESPRARRAATGASSPARPTRRPTRRGTAWNGWLANDQLTTLQQTLRLAAPDTLHTISFGSPWWDLLVSSSGQRESLNDAVARLTRDPRRDAQSALHWLLTQLTEGLDATTDHLTVVADARDRVAPSGTEPAAPVEVPAPPEPFRTETLPFNYLKDGLEAGRGVVRVRTGNVSRRGGGCTGWLVTPSLVVVPSHLVTFVTPDYPLDSLRFENADVQQIFTQTEIDLDFDGTDTAPRTLLTDRLEFFDPRIDIALLRLREEVTDRAPLQVGLGAVAPGYSPIALIHHPDLGAKQISIQGGRVLAHNGRQMTYVVATRPGSAGGPVMDASWRVLATHTSFRRFRHRPEERGIDAKVGAASTALLAGLREASPHGLWREIVAAQPGFKTIDSTLRQKLMNDEQAGMRSVTVPFVIDILNDQVSLDDIPDLHIRSRRGTLVTAIGTTRSLDALERKPQIVSVAASLPGGAAECAVSIPHIGAVRVHVPEIVSRKKELGDAALVAVIDEGIDVTHEAFRNANGDSRILAFWDQQDLGTVPAGMATRGTSATAISPAGEAAVKEFNLAYGALYLQEDIQRFLAGEPLPATFPPLARMQHGTTVCSIAAGRRTGDDTQRDFAGGVAPEAGLIVVRYDLRDATIGYNAGHIDALNFIDALARKAGKPVVVNISNGMNTGAHDGTSDLEKMCESFLDQGAAPSRAIVKSAGNERNQRRHAVIGVAQGQTGKFVWQSKPAPRPDPVEKTLDEIFELWFDSLNNYRFRVTPPKGSPSPWVEDKPDFDRLTERLSNLNRVEASLEQFHASGNGRFRLIIKPGDQPSVAAGHWKLEAEGLNISTNKPIHAWVERMANRDVRFLRDDKPEVTITIPGTSPNVIVVGAVEVGDSMYLHDESSEGPTRTGAEKPDLVAPGVRIRAALAGSGVRADAPPIGEEEFGHSGSSFAAPHVTGAIALLLSALAKDPRRPPFNARQIRNKLLLSARHFAGQWKPGTGYGELDVDALFTKCGL